MLQTMLLPVLCSLMLMTSSAKTSTRDKRHAQAVQYYETAEFAKAANLFRQELSELLPEERGGTIERDVRESLVLSLYNGGQRDQARASYNELIATFPDFRFDPDKVLPEAIEFFEGDRQPKEIKPASPPPPQAETTQKKPWRWYYLAPLGVGQYLAGSPVRGAIFSVTQVGFLAMNIAGIVLLAQQRFPDRSVRDVAKAETAQAIMDVGFFGLIAAVIAGTVDGAAFEP